MIEIHKEGRRNHYRVNYDANVGVTLVPGGVELRTVLRFLASRTLRILEGEAPMPGDEDLMAKAVTRL